MARTHKATAVKLLRNMETKRNKNMNSRVSVSHNGYCADEKFVNELLNHLLMACCKKNCAKHIALAKAKFIAHTKS